ncbi:Exopolyphosphatase [Echinococcus granulosus]|uniref:Protein prune n=1 Tax=Echinococcus granulosus TaxID=6210 RepID=A0A068WCR8_ECHGR|nr:Exopolyphosphatase [Echinococcus granulosus]CDS17862.1 protein prune [Echinococcus granulosus]
MLSAFLKNLHSFPKPNSGFRFVIVTGNESCDLDSIACATCYAYIKSKEDLSDKAIYIPYCNIPESDLDLRTEATFWLRNCQIDKKDLFFTGSLDWLLTPEYANKLSVILVDHFQKESGNAFKFCPVVEIIDHHPLLSSYRKPDTCKYFLVEKVGSCSSLLVHELFNRLPRVLTPLELCQLLYGAILIDTDGLSQQALDIQKATQKDVEAVRKLEAFAGAELLAKGTTRATVYSEILAAKFCIDGLSLWDLLRRDCKKVFAGSETHPDIVCSTITGMDFKELLEHREFSQEATRFCEEQNARVLVCVTVGLTSLCTCDQSHDDPIATPLPRESRRAVVVTAPAQQRNLLDSLWAYLMANAKEFLLDRPSDGKCSCSNSGGEVESGVYVALITNKAVTRKQLIPILIDFLLSQK